MPVYGVIFSPDATRLNNLSHELAMTWHCRIDIDIIVHRRSAASTSGPAFWLVARQLTSPAAGPPWPRRNARK